MALQTLKIKLNGRTMLINAPKLANPLHPLKKIIDPISKKRDKTDDDYMRLMDLYWISGITCDDDMKLIEAEANAALRESTWAPIHIPGSYIEGAVKKAMMFMGHKRISKTARETGFWCADDKINLSHDGGNNLYQIWKNPSFRDVRLVPSDKNGKKLFCRPRFDSWHMETSILFDDSLINLDDLVEAIRLGGQVAGIGAYNKRYGKYTVEVLA